MSNNTTYYSQDNSSGASESQASVADSAGSSYLKNEPSMSQESYGLLSHIS